MAEEPDDGNGVKNGTGVKMLATFFAGIIITGLAAFLAYPHNLPTSADMDKNTQQLEQQINSLQSQMNLQNTELTTIRIRQAKIAFKLGIPDDGSN
jgi:hypothetical protein